MKYFFTTIAVLLVLFGLLSVILNVTIETTIAGYFIILCGLYTLLMVYKIWHKKE